MYRQDNSSVVVDGAQGEGGGQIIRTSVALSAITGRPVEIKNIRAKRSKPGLQAQHLTSVTSAATLCEAEVTGATLGSQWIRFEPRQESPLTQHQFDVAQARQGGSAGATGLVAQTILAPMACMTARPFQVTLLGGTHVPMSPPSDYLEWVYLPLLKQLGVEATLQLHRAGFFPRGGGQIQITLESGRLSQPLLWEKRGKLTRLRLVIVTSQLPDHVAQRGQDTLLKDLKGYGVPIEIELRNKEGNGAGAAITLIAECETGLGGFSALGERGKPMERVAMEALRHFQKWYESQKAVDEHLADQLVLPASLIPQTSLWTTPQVTEHLRTVIAVTQQFLPIEVTLAENADGSGSITLTGC